MDANISLEPIFLLPYEEALPSITKIGGSFLAKILIPCPGTTYLMFILFYKISFIVFGNWLVEMSEDSLSMSVKYVVLMEER